MPYHYPVTAAYDRRSDMMVPTADARGGEYISATEGKAIGVEARSSV